MDLFQPKSDDIKDLEIRDRYIKSSRNEFTQHYVIKDDGAEVGFLSLDLNPLDQPLVIYEIFVPRHLRRRGFGTQLLELAERQAHDLGYEWALIIPKSLDDTFPQSDLELWYQKHGYEEWKEHAGGGIRKRI